MKGYKKADVQFHRDGFGPSHPAINIKVHSGFDKALAKFKADNPDVPARFTREWIEANADAEGWWQEACQHGFELAEDTAKEIFGKHVEVYSEGRSGGWLIVEGLDAFESWNGAMLAKWAKFERYCKELVADIPYQTADLIYYNVFLTKQEEQDAELTQLQEGR